MKLTKTEFIFNLVFNYIVMVLFLLLLPLLIIFLKEVRDMWASRFILETVAKKMNE